MASLALNTQLTLGPTTAAKPTPGPYSTVENRAHEPQSSSPLSASQRSNQRNLAILEANQQASLSTPNQPLSLLYQTAIDAINAELEPTMGENAVERLHAEGIDTSPAATADRIISLAIGSFGQYQSIHPDQDESQQAEGFLALISSGIEQGFAEAKEILNGLSVLEGTIAEDISKTYDLVQEGLQKFREMFSANTKNDDDVSEAEPPVDSTHRA